MKTRQSCLVAMLLILMFQSQAFAEVKIGVAIAQIDTYLAVVRSAMEAKASATPGVSLQFQNARADVVTQLNQVQAFIDQKMDALIVLPVDTSATRNITKAAVAAKIPLVYTNRVPKETLPEGVVTVACDDYASGVAQMEYLAQKMGGKGSVVIILGDLANHSTADRTRGVQDVIKRFPGIKVAEKQTAVWNRDQAMDLVSNWVLAGTEIDAVASNNDEMAIGAAMALRQTGKKNVPIGGVDGTRDGLAAVASGQITATVLQPAQLQGTSSVEAALKLVKHEPFETQTVIIPHRLVTRDNVKEIQNSQNASIPRADAKAAAAR